MSKKNVIPLFPQGSHHGDVVDLLEGIFGAAAETLRKFNNKRIEDELDRNNKKDILSLRPEERKPSSPE